MPRELPMSDARKPMTPSRTRFVKGNEVAPEAAKALEGSDGQSEGYALSFKPLMVGEHTSIIEVHRGKGLVDPVHAHGDHESLCYLVSGRMRVIIEDESFIAEPGDSWIHPPGVVHYHETLEDSVQLEVKSPAIKAWS